MRCRFRSSLTHGFTAEGTLQSMDVHRGVPVDAVSFSRIRSVARVLGGEPV